MKEVVHILYKLYRNTTYACLKDILLYIAMIHIVPYLPIYYSSTSVKHLSLSDWTTL